MSIVDRRSFLETALSIGATAAWAEATGVPSSTRWVERRDLYPEGVASGDPEEDSVLLWTRKPGHGREMEEELIVEVSRDPLFRRVLVATRTLAARDADWTCRVLVGGLEPGKEYWYRFSDRHGFGSRVGRTRTAPQASDGSAVRFLFTRSCVMPREGQSAYRQIPFDALRAEKRERIDFVLHAGDFLHEVGVRENDRTEIYSGGLRDSAGGSSRAPMTLSDYRANYCALLRDADLQDARARWPFVNMRDRHEYRPVEPRREWAVEEEAGLAGKREVAAGQAFFEYQPARISRPGRRWVDRFRPQHVPANVLQHLGEPAPGERSNALAELGSYKRHRRIRWGQHLDLIITEEPPEQPGGRARDGEATRSTALVHAREKWLQEQLRSSTATWKIWGNLAIDGAACEQHSTSTETDPPMRHDQSDLSGGSRGTVKICNSISNFNRGEFATLVHAETIELSSDDGHCRTSVHTCYGERAQRESSIRHGEVIGLAASGDQLLHLPLANMSSYGCAVVSVTRETIAADNAFPRLLTEPMKEDPWLSARDWIGTWWYPVTQSVERTMLNKQAVGPS
jgi:phosphodiesterase/alkaline phosphatase D-like protein